MQPVVLNKYTSLAHHNSKLLSNQPLTQSLPKIVLYHSISNVMDPNIIPLIDHSYSSSDDEF